MNIQIRYSLFLLLILFRPVASQEFDEKFDHWPVDLKINGMVVIDNRVGGDKLAKLIDRSVPKKERGDEDGLVYATIISDLTTLNEDWKKRNNIHPDSVTVDPSTGDLNKAIESIKKSKVVFLYARAMLHPEFHSKTQKLKGTLSQFISDKGILIANRMAAKYLGEKVLISSGPKTAPTTTEITTKEGLGLIPDAIIETKSNSSSKTKRLRGAIAAHPRLVGISVDPGSCLVLRGRKFFAYEKGSADFMLAANERLPRRIQKIGIPLHQENRAKFGNNLLDLTEWRRDAIDRTLPPFPPAEPRDPYVDNGTLVIVGGGGMPQNLMKDLVDMAGGKDAKMVYVPCSESEDVGTRHRTVEYWKSLGVKSATFIHTKDRNKSNSDEQFLAPLKDATGLWFGGGRQWNFADSYYGTKAHKLMKDVLKRGGVIGGSSAGASVQARYLARATPIGNFRIMAPGYERGGLGFISGVAIDQHFTQRGRQKDMTQLMKVHPQLLGIGIDEATAIIVRKSKASVVGRGKVHFYDRRLPVFPNKPDFIALPAGSEYDLKSRKVLKEAKPKKKESAQDSKKASKQQVKSSK